MIWKSVLLLFLLASIPSQAKSDSVYPGPKMKNGERFFVFENFPRKGEVTGSRTIRVYLPSDYHLSKKTYRVIYFFDGEHIFSKNLQGYNKASINADRYLEELLDEDLVHPAILVGIHVTNSDNRRKMRQYETTPWPFKFRIQDPPEGVGGGLEETYTFITASLKPFIDGHFRTKPDAQFTGIAGISLGGLAACYLAYTYPESFGMAGCISPSLWWGHHKLVSLVDKNPKPKHRARFWLYSTANEPWRPVRRLFQNMISDGWVDGDDVAYLHDDGFHDYPSWNKQMRRMLCFLLRKKPSDPSCIAFCKLDLVLYDKI